MRPFSITFAEAPFGFGLGIGVTAIDEVDARRFANAVCADELVASINWIRDAAELDEGHVIPNMGNLLRRGVWFPRGYEHLT